MSSLPASKPVRRKDIAKSAGMPAKQIQQATTGRPGRGRPRSKETDAAIEEACWIVLGLRGYDRMTFEAVADRAGCSRSTMYRRYASKLELVEKMLHKSTALLSNTPRDGASPRDILITYLTYASLSLVGPRRQAMLSLLEAGARITELGTVINRYTGEHKVDYWFPQFQRVAKAPIDPTFADFIYDSLAGSVLYNLTVSKRPLDTDLLGLLVDQALLLASRAPAFGRAHLSVV